MAKQPGHKRESRSHTSTPRPHPPSPSHSTLLPLPHSLSFSLSSSALLLLLTASLCHTAWGTPFSPDDSFLPACDGLLGDPPPGGWKRWSNPATWEGAPVPGVGAQAGANVTIPCGTGVLLDLPSISLTVLNILGSLKFLDDPTLPRVSLYASFVIVEGRFIIGNPGAQFSQKAYIELIPNPNGRADFLYTARAPADPENPRNLGHKAFAIVGGQVDFHGLPGPVDLPVWVKLAATASAGSSRLLVKGDVSGWQPYAPIVIAPTDFYYDQEDVATISSVNCSGTAPGTCEILLSRPLYWNHFGDPLGVPDGFGGYIEETAEVALLSRNIVITGTDEPAPHDLEGGHFIVFMTNTPQYIEGVQFLLMGQQGMIGRYPIHFHLCGDQQGRSLIHSNLITHSKQRCVVIHATFNATLQNNVAYNTTGHCFMLEEGSEEGNTFSYNLGMRTHRPQVKISDDETDDKPATFWISNPNNNFVGNSAGGSQDSGFWLELRYAVRGLSAIWAKVNRTIPIRYANLGVFQDNTAHSCQFFGFRSYKHGYMPRENSTVGNEFTGPPVWREIGNFNLWKCNEGANLHIMSHVVFSNSTLADNVRALYMHDNEFVNATGLRIVGQSSNLGNPYDCAFDYGTSTCAPISGCAFPLPPGVQGRSPGYGSNNHSVLGVVMDVKNLAVNGNDGLSTQALTNTTFSGFGSTCSHRIFAAIGVGTFRGMYWNAGTHVQGLRFSSTPANNRVYLFPPHYQDGTNQLGRYDDGEPARFYALRDLDGSLLGAGPGYAVAANDNILPSVMYSNNDYSNSSSTPPAACQFVDAWNGFSCPGVCYRTLQILYDEPGFTLYPFNYTVPYPYFPDGPRVLGDYSYINVTWVKDGRSFPLEGNLRQYAAPNTTGIGGGYPETTRVFPVSLLAGETYEIAFVPPTGNSSFVPLNVELMFKDGPGCGQGLTLRFKASPSRQYAWALNPDTAVQLGGGATYGNTGNTVSRIAMPVLNASAPISFQVVCNQTAAGASNATGVQELEIMMRPTLPPTTPLTLVPILSQGTCVGAAPVAGGVAVASGVPSTSQGHAAMVPWKWVSALGVVLPFVMLL